MAGVTYWDGSTDTSAITAANWTVGTGPGSAPPIVNDEVIFDGRANETNPCTTDCAVGNTGGIDYDLLHIKVSCTYNVGLANAPFHTSAQKIIIEGTGTYYIECSETALGADQTIPLVIINNKNATVYLTSNENTASWCCEFTEVIVLAGTVYIGNNGTSAVDTAVETLRSYPRLDRDSYTNITIEEDCERYKATTYKMTIHFRGGALTTDSAATLIDQSGGTITYGTDGAAETDMNIDTLIMTAGTFNWQPDDTGEDAYIGALHIYGGVFDATSSTNITRSRVLGGFGDIRLFLGATMKLNNGMGNITRDPSSQLYNFGGDLKLDNYTADLWVYDLA